MVVKQPTLTAEEMAALKMSNEHDEIRARYEAAMEVMPSAERQTLKLEAVTASLADIPRLLEGRDEGEGWAWVRNKLEVCCPEFTTKKPRTGHLAGTKYEVMGWMHIVCSYAVAAYRTYIDIAMEQQQRADEAENEASALRAQLAERDAEIGRLEGILQSATETFTAAQLGKESQIESLSTENKRLREAVEGIQERASKFLPADVRPGRIGTAREACLWIFNECKGILRRRGEAMEEKGDDFYIVVEKGNTRNIYDDKGLVRSEEKGEQGDE